MRLCERDGGREESVWLRERAGVKEGRKAIEEEEREEGNEREEEIERERESGRREFWVLAQQQIEGVDLGSNGPSAWRLKLTSISISLG